MADALERVVRLGFRRIIVFPYFLFTGILVKRIYSAADILAEAHPEVEVIKASYLNDHPLVIDAFLERLEEIPGGDNLMNCQLCKYREQIIGYEKDKGAAQVGHHHHVEGIGTDALKAAEDICRLAVWALKMFGSILSLCSIGQSNSYS